MKTAGLTVMALAMITASGVFGAIGETPEQFESFKPTEVNLDKYGGAEMIWVGKRVSHAGYFINGRAVSESIWFTDQHPISKVECAKLLKPYDSLIQRPITVEGVEFYQYETPVGGVVVFVAGYNFRLNVINLWAPEVFEAMIDQAREANAENNKHVTPLIKL
jgi:hypothetical protein